MFGFDEDGADSHCVNCGHAIYFEVGPGLFSCPSCGKNPDKTDEQIQKEKEENERLYQKSLTPEYWIDEMRQKLDDLSFSLSLMPWSDDFPIEAKLKLNWLAKEINNLQQKL